MIGYIDCPYCVETIKIEYEGVRQGEDFDCICEDCKRHFLCNYEIDHIYNITKGCSCECHSRTGQGWVHCDKCKQAIAEGEKA